MLLFTLDSMKCFQRTIGCWLPCLCKDGVAIIVNGWAHAMLVNKMLWWVWGLQCGGSGGNIGGGDVGCSCMGHPNNP